MTTMAFDPPVSEKQRRAMWAAREGRSTIGIPRSVGEKFVGPNAHDSDGLNVVRSVLRGILSWVAQEAREPAHDEAPMNAAGVAVTAPNSSMLFLRRAKGDHAGTWCLPGGGAEDGETPQQTALRELKEETGYAGGELAPLHHEPGDKVNYHTFSHRVKDRFDPKLNDEHDAFKWSNPCDPPQPLHPGVRAMLIKLAQDEIQGAVVDLPKDSRGLFKKPDFKSMSDDKKRDFATGMQKRRMEAAMRAHFADATSGLPNTRDDLGGYLCRSGSESRGCNGEVGGKCIKVNLNRSDLNDPKVFFSCDLFDRKCVGDPELNKPTIDPAKAGVAEAKRPYGCKNCTKKEPCPEFVDQFGRDHWCGEWGITMRLDDCCGENDNPTIELNADGSRKDQAADGPAANIKLEIDPQRVVDKELDRTGHALDEMPMALDRESVRSIIDGRLHVARTHISKANICEYFGREIPHSIELGLEQDRKYRLLRDPKELEKAASTFNGIQVLRQHVPVSPNDPKQWEVVGTTGTDAVFEEPYLDNSLSIWVQSAIDGINSGDKEELSCGYRYKPDMTPGTYEGQAYDGVMRNIVGNHVALVPKGRAGPDVVVGDSAIETATTENEQMAKKTRLGAYLAGRLLPMIKVETKPVIMALDAAIGTVSAKAFPAAKPQIKAALLKIKTEMAHDADLDGIHSFLDSLDKPSNGQPDMLAELMDDPEKTNTGATSSAGDPAQTTAATGQDDEPTSFLKGKLSPEDYAVYDKICKDKAARDSETEEERKKREAAGKKDESVSKPAMDAAIAKVKTETRNEVMAINRGIREAERFVQPWVGNLAMAFDSAEEVHRATLDLLKVDHDGVPAEALPHIIRAQPVPGTPAPRRQSTAMAMDAAAQQSFATRFPGARDIKIA